MAAPCVLAARRPLFSLHVAAALGLGGCKLNPFSFQPFGGVADDMHVIDGCVPLPDGVRIGFERKKTLGELFAALDTPDAVARR